MLSDELFIRYQRQICLPELGELGQKKLSQAHVLVIGCGGLGSAATLYLAAAGVGRIVLVDDDVVEESNLQRQIAYRQADIQQAKATALANQLKQLNSHCHVRSITQRLADSQLGLEVTLADLVLDCSDNLATRHQVNKACYKQQTPLISAAAIGWQGQFIVFDYGIDCPCYRCLYPFDQLNNTQNCSDQGIVGPVVGILGNYQALAAIQKLSTGQFMLKPNQLHIFDGQGIQWQTLDVVQDSQCDVCSMAISPTGVYL